jgi:isocitrate/isopropylmalate dehydrogenase
MLLQYIGEPRGADLIHESALNYLRASERNHLPIELGGRLKTNEVGDMIAEVMKEDPDFAE